MVWSDQTIQQLSREFVTVADEVYLLYPEDPGNLARVANDPAHRFFKQFGEAMPKGDWNHPGTKQGIYMIGPDGEYLEGKFAASSDPRDIEARLRRALERWEQLRKQKKYANRPVPAVPEQVPPGLANSPLLLRVSLRDLPRRDGNSAALRWRPGSFDDRNWGAFMNWAWNQNWAAVSDPSAFVTTSKDAQTVPPAAYRQLFREVLVDNVRGQTQSWQDSELQQAELTVRRLSAAKYWQLEYSGVARMEGRNQRLSLRLHGEAEWDPKQQRFVQFALVAIGERQGAGTFNQRTQDPGPAPIGMALRLFAPEQAAPRRRR